MKEVFEETCPYCDNVNEYPVIKGLAYMQCEQCGKLIKTCAMCYDEHTNCNNCKLDKLIEERILRKG